MEIICTSKNGFVKGLEGRMQSGIENSFIRLVFDTENGFYNAYDCSTNREIISNAYFQIDNEMSVDGSRIYGVDYEKVEDGLGTGLCMKVTGSSSTAPPIILQINLYEESCFCAMRVGVINTSNQDIVMKYHSVLSGKAFEGHTFSNYMVLNGESAGKNTKVTRSISSMSKNNIMALFGESGNWRTLVIGGLTYHDFEKFARITRCFDSLDIDLWAEDPVGRLVEPGEKYISEDWFYIDFITNNPFVSLENYGASVCKAQQIDLNSPSHLIINHWYPSQERFGKMEERYDSAGTIISLDEVVRSGIDKYTKVAVRLEPDDYSFPNNQQGWWDDTHFSMYKSGSLVKPYETIEKWGEAVAVRGGIPFIYCQSGRRSQDYCVQHPDHMLFNDAFAKRSKGGTGWWNGGKGDIYWGYDYTDPGFIHHLEEVYRDYRKAGIKGIKFDYPETNWCYDGGFEDKKATAASAHRKMYEAAWNGLGHKSDIQDRLGMGDVTIGVITTKRTEGDLDRMYPPTVARNGLRWYKNRILYHIDTDVKNPLNAVPNNLDGVRAMFTMTYVVSGRMELGVYISSLNSERKHALTRIFPFHTAHKSARPADAFCGKRYPEVYDFEVSPKWHQVTFFNTRLDKGEWPGNWLDIYKDLQNNPIETQVSIDLSGDPVGGSLCLNPRKSYHVFDFWNNSYVGKLKGYERLEQMLRPGEARMMSVHEVCSYPQFISTNRHIMQGYVDMTAYPIWDPETNKLTGRSLVVGGESYKVVIALNGYEYISCSAIQNVKCILSPIPSHNGLVELIIDSAENADIQWSVSFR